MLLNFKLETYLCIADSDSNLYPDPNMLIIPDPTDLHPRYWFYVKIPINNAYWYKLHLEVSNLLKCKVTFDPNGWAY
jgi:hypothetical protein